jgi:hypothetical protein
VSHECGETHIALLSVGAGGDIVWLQITGAERGQRYSDAGKSKGLGNPDEVANVLAPCARPPSGFFGGILQSRNAGRLTGGGAGTPSGRPRAIESSIPFPARGRG